jgi:hypothetical protein
VQSGKRLDPGTAGLAGVVDDRGASSYGVLGFHHRPEILWKKIGRSFSSSGAVLPEERGI